MVEQSPSEEQLPGATCAGQLSFEEFSTWDEWSVVGSDGKMSLLEQLLNGLGEAHAQDP